MARKLGTVQDVRDKLTTCPHGREVVLADTAPDLVLSDCETCSEAGFTVEGGVVWVELPDPPEWRPAAFGALRASYAASDLRVRKSGGRWIWVVRTQHRHTLTGEARDEESALRDAEAAAERAWLARAIRPDG